MSIRTRRRISPRARRRYQQIRNFFQRTLSSLTSVSANRLNSSTTENNFHSAGRGCPLHAVPENYRSPTRPRDLGRRHTEELTPVGRNTNSPAQRRRRFSDRNMTQADTKLLYKTEDNLGCNSRECGLRCHNKLIRDREQNSSDLINYPQSTSSQHTPCHKQNKKKRDTFDKVEGRVSLLGKREGRMVIENSIFDSDSCESLAISIRRADLQASTSRCRQQDHDRCKIQPHEVRMRTRRDKPKRYKSKSPHDKKRKNRNNEPPGKDDQFISDIINRQYKPMSFFGRKASDISQISTPVCRDKQHSKREMPIPDSEVSSFCRGPVVECANMRNMHSVSDLQSYTAPRPARHRRYRTENYNDSSIYDVVPVREKTSPKSRRKFIEDNLIFNEVPPSPRTQRPRLNLETQNYSDYEYYEKRETQSKRRRSPHVHMRPDYECEQTYRGEMSPEESPRTRPNFEMHLNNFSRLHDDIGTTMSSQHYLTSQNNTTGNTLDNSKVLEREGTPSVDKTDKALSEIKNILQNFLQELKKDSSSSQCDHCDQASGSTAKNNANDETLRGSGTSNAMKNSAASSFNCSLGPASAPTVPAQFIPPGYVNPCCYSPMIPMFATNGLPYLVASPSCVCATVACGHNHTQQQQADTHDVSFRTCSKVNCTEADAAKTNCETDVLIREIYNYVTRNPSFDKTHSSKLPQDQFGQLPRAKETGKSMHALQHDAKFGTPPLRCYSKSCEAIVSRQHLNTYYATYPSYSDSLLGERLSQETVVDCRMPRETNEHNFQEKKTPKVLEQNPQESKFVSALRLLRTRANKKKRKEVVHEVCDSEKSIEVDIVPKGRPQFRQEYNTYMMHGQELYHTPPLRHEPRGSLSIEHDYSQYEPYVNEHRGPPPASERFPYHERMPPSAPYMYDNDNSFENRPHSIPSQVPLCLKEVEVRSVGIQSERKTTTFRLFSEKKDLKEAPKSSQTRFPVSILRKDRPQTSTSQKISFNKTTKLQKARKGFNFNKPAASSKSEPLTSFTDKMKEDITKNDKTVANAMLKKLFYKRNPFSPQNRFVRTILEKDSTEFKWRPRMFIL